ncbi:protein of unknown function DUF1549 [Planctopirus limnophila DSM 3776]|uniref:Fucolectin tachylectin-4 pentraxin-1 domain-containing protein n=1 Tax=Planctopirus limnophila (strain ATCC 43296 / DSM 3776 / IFAM 1008 / Mu 290) TaxID=521674 RepID=D5STL4_PLAL2|nr:DUF1553 domain-containing protein [Planctopirus limnophila]ADG69043.1 protein of unknown function DUF1549 [Planctopirus limnophila DSM 3776]
MARYSTSHWLGSFIGCGIAFLTFVPSAQAESVSFVRDIKPILSNACFHCHGPDEADRKGGTDGLRLDTFEGATADLGGGAQAIKAGHPEASGMIERILSTDADLVMPPPSVGRKLSPREVDLLKKWISEGAKYEPHWSYVKPVRPVIVATQHQPDQSPAVMAGAIDELVQRKLKELNLKPAAEADREALIRRVSLDLTGLPPTREELQAFLEDTSSNAYEKVVDRLLASSAYGEHWAHRWLDLARYADSAGYADDPPRTIWAYRDYVIESLNRNKPFDQFTIEQLAGDLLPNATREQRIATAFHRNTLTNNEGGTNDEEFRTVAVVDRVNTTFAVWMGTTMACAQCHTHKYDPLSQKEYFEFYALLNNTADADRRDESPLESWYTPEQESERQRLKDLIARHEQTLSTLPENLVAEFQAWDTAFPRTLQWHALIPEKLSRESGLELAVQADGRIEAREAAPQDVYTLSIPAKAGQSIGGLRLETIPDPALPGGGAGHGGGNFVISRIEAQFEPADRTQAPQARFVRIRLPGAGKMIHLAEVEVKGRNASVPDTSNLALHKPARQSSTDFGGAAERAVDGNTGGDFYQNSVTHTAVSQDPWWEVDLQQVSEIDEIVLWNRTDGSLEQRLAGYIVELLGENREVVYSQAPATVPSPQISISPRGKTSLPISIAVADYSQKGFSAESLLSTGQIDPKQGWAVGGQHKKRHQLMLLPPEPWQAPGDGSWVITIRQQSSQAKHLLGSFQIMATSDPQVTAWMKYPAAARETLSKAADQRTDDDHQLLVKTFLEAHPALEPVRKQKADDEKALANIRQITVPVYSELPQGQTRETRVQLRGNYLDLGEPVSPGIPAVFMSQSHQQINNRLEMARWLVSADNPLTARVIANRYWEDLFGVGLVSTSEEFGSQGELPSHPELLDWLATELHRVKWDLKAFIKTIVMSQTYRQSSRTTQEAYLADPENRWLARGPRLRLSAEMVRDQALFVSGLLSRKMGGPPVRPPQPKLGLNAAFGGNTDWETSQGEDQYRRAIYTQWRRSNPYPSMITFDAPTREVCNLRRVRTNTPLQALVTLNDPVIIEASQHLAQRMLKEAPADLEGQIAWIWSTVLCRQPTPEESNKVKQLYESTLQTFQQDLKQARQLAGDSQIEESQVAQRAAWTTIANVILNLDEALMKR